MSYPRVSEWKRVTINGRDYVAHKYSICATSYAVVAVFETYAGHLSYMTTGDDSGTTKLGTVASRPLPVTIDSLRGEARLAACDAFRAANVAEIFAAIGASYPEDLARGTRRGTDLEIEI